MALRRSHEPPWMASAYGHRLSREPVMHLLSLVVLISGGCCAALCWQLPGLRHRVCRVMPFLLLAIGVLGLVLAVSQASFGGEPVDGRAQSWRAALVLQSLAFLAAGLWLTWRVVGTSLGSMNRPGRPRWNLLLLPVVVILLILLLHADGLYTARIAIPVTAVMALTVLILLPAVAADLAAAALALLGIAGIANAAWPPFDRPLVASAVAVPGPGGGFVQSSTAAPIAGGVLDLVAAVQGVAILAFGLWLAQRTIVVHARELLRPGPDPELSGRVEQLTQARADAVDSAAAELRRVERDLHDGAQARLVALGMNLRAAERLIHTSPAAAVALVAEARQASSLALTELRDLVRGIYPPVLADRGLADAVRALALDTPIRTEVDINLPRRLEFPVETACYFAVAEALANAVKHSGARLVQIRMRYSPGPRSSGLPASGVLRIEITDNGTGGADPAKGTGLAGIERRLGTFDGILAVSSPPGGPTMIIMEVPCALSLPRTSSC
jgi:signal transduction histidine kinase